MKRYSLYFAWLLALIATLGSLYISEVLEYNPCPLCWYQRICVFPIAIILGAAAYRRFYAIAGYLMILSILGMALAIYQILIQEIPSFTPLPLCGKGGGCQEIGFTLFNVITLPMLGLANFFLITLFLNTARKLSRASANRP